MIATATVFFHRFYLKNAYCETDPWIVIAACVYLAAKAEESPVHIKNVLSEARNVFSRTSYFLVTDASHPPQQRKATTSNPSPLTTPN